MISQQRAARKRLDSLVHAAERLAAVQYEAGLRAAGSETAKRERTQAKVNKCWNEFRIACDALKDYSETPPLIVRWPR